MFFFPKIYKNELLYSVIARYHENSGNISYIHTIEDVFGDRNGIATVALPSRIKNLVENLMDYQEDFAMEIINKNTLLNFYAAFKSEEIYTEVMQDMIERRGIGNHMKLGLVSSSTRLDRYLKFCPVCVREDLAIHGEAFWHREHQVFGAKVCHLHREILHSSKFPVFGRNRQIYYCITPEVCESIRENLYDSSELNIDLLQKIAIEINELCNYKVTLALPDFKNRVRALLYDKGYVKPNNYTNLKGLIDDIRKYYTDELLDFVGCSIVKKNWVAQILNPSRGVGQPMEVLLLLIFLDFSVKEFHEMENMENINIKKYIQEVWDKELIQLLDKDLSQREICRLLSSNRKTVLKAMERLNIKKDWNSNGGSRYRGIEYVKTDEYKVVETKTKESWIELHKMYPNLSSHQIRKKNDHVYAWLKKYQSDWLKVNYRLVSVDSAKVDWEARDIELSNKIMAIVSQFKSSIGNRITWATVGGELGIGGWLYRKRERLPRCKALIDKNVETLQQYHLRVLRLAAYELAESEVNISKYTLLQYAGVKERFASKLVNMFNEEDMKIGLSCLI